MRILPFAHILGMWLLLFSGALLPPTIVSLLYQDGEITHYSTSLLCSLLLGMALWLPTSRQQIRLRTRDGFVIVIMLWITTSLLGCLPFIFGLGMSPADAFFESVSAFTTTGSTVITGLDSLPQSILFFRQEMQWLGGIGIVVSAIALLPMLGIGGMQMLKAEMTGPIKDEKLTPRIAHTARALWKLYLSMTVACAVFYWFGGMSVFDAVTHSLSTISTGGFSTHDASIAYFDSVYIESIAIIFMILGGINFGIHLKALQHTNLRSYWDNVEVRAFLLMIAVVVIVISGVLYFEGTKESYPAALRYAMFTVVSVVTSTGFGIDDFSVWPTMIPLLLIFISFVGGCAGSTAGGMKVIRFLVVGKGAGLELQRLIHPHIVKPLRLQKKVIAPAVVDAVRGFFSLYIATFVVILLILMATGMDQVTAFGAVATCMNNLGPGLGDVAANFQSVSDFSKWILSFAMLLGRLEIFTLLVVLSHAFWRS